MLATAGLRRGRKTNPSTIVDGAERSFPAPFCPGMVKSGEKVFEVSGWLNNKLLFAMIN